MKKEKKSTTKLMLLALVFALNLTLVTYTPAAAQFNNPAFLNNYPDLSQKLPQLPTSKTVVQSGKWRDTGLLLPKLSRNCFDATHPGIILVINTDPAVGPNGIYSYNWLTNQKNMLTSNIPAPDNFGWACNEYNGLLFIRNLKNRQLLRYSLAESEGREIEHFPTAWATDGSLQLYANGWSSDKEPIEIDTNHQLWVSNDGGLSWQERKQAPAGGKGLAVNRLNGQALYLLTQVEDTWTIYFSADSGLTWEKRSERVEKRNFTSFEVTYSLSTISGNTADVNTLELMYSYLNPHVGNPLLLSTDGGRTFNVASIYQHVWLFPELYQTSQGILRVSSYEKTFGVSTNGGKDWKDLTSPFTPQSNPDYTFIQAQNRPDNLYFQGHLGDVHPLWYSPDGGVNWQELGPDQISFRGVTPYAPTTLIGVNQDNKLQVLEQLEADKTVTKTVIPNLFPGGKYFPETGHNLQGIFLNYWQAHGGLAQFGYPKTEEFREYNPADGKIYTVQYFERNRFEYHPENVGTPYVVLLGLLGNQLTKQRRAGGEAVFKPVADPNLQNYLYFPQTGHTLSSRFKSYWEANGGLAVYGYPISEEFKELNPNDGKVYNVQYFERNRFEYHPENVGTPYEVLLGLLGNSLIKVKGWSY